MFELDAPGRSTHLGLSRRSFLKAGVIGLGGLACPSLARPANEERAPSASTNARSPKAVIQIFLSGGPSQHDTFDPKPDAPVEYRGPFQSISTRLPGVRITELFPRVAGLMDRMSILRSVHHADGSHHHSYHWMLTGYYPQNLQFYVNQRPAIGSVVARFRGPNRAGMPAYVGIPRASGYGNAAYLGVGYNPFAVSDPNSPRFAVPDLQLPEGVTHERLAERRTLQRSFDRMRRDFDANGVAAGMDTFNQAALDLVAGPVARRALDLTREDSRLRDAYGRTRLGQSCLMARRLVEAGVTYVMIEDYEFMEWDLHGAPSATTVEAGTRLKGPHLDWALASLIADLELRGLLDQVLVVVAGEFGRTPLINPAGGRDHWGNVFSVLLAGGGLRHGQVIGSSTARGEQPRDRPLRPDDVLATTYHVLGIDARQTVPDQTGRPREILSQPEPIRELV
ncbi:MAG: DUF1501 domain-containing protein [Planctomycetes bacterium]|nr:DUF1501 domain-containing protein [Planctomycetota bacterium]